MTVMLSKNFALIEFTKSQTAERKGIANTPNEASVMAMEELCHSVLEPIRSAFAKPININSGYRSAALCEAIGSKSTSQHCDGEAADIEIYGVSNYELAKYIEKNLNFDQLILECWNKADLNSGWVHVSYVGANVNRKDVLTYNKTDGYTKGIE
jgi:zinc D-Ala-D-Ala carboxypeptidase